MRRRQRAGRRILLPGERPIPIERRRRDSPGQLAGDADRQAGERRVQQAITLARLVRRLRIVAQGQGSAHHRFQIAAHIEVGAFIGVEGHAGSPAQEEERKPQPGQRCHQGRPAPGEAPRSRRKAAFQHSKLPAGRMAATITPVRD